jgi:hypothetical protein
MSMSMSMYQASVPVFIKMLTNLRTILEKAAAHAQAKKIDETVFVESRLFPDMLPLRRQVQIAADQAKGVARLGGVEPPTYEDNEQSLAELINRVTRTIDFLATLKPAQIDGSEDREITRPVRGQPKTFKGMNFLLHFVLPNFYFHTTTAYAILRHNGVQLGKADFLGKLD